MPTIRVTVPRDAWSREEKADIVNRLTSGLAAAGSAAGKGDITQYITVHIDEMSDGGYAIGGQVVG